MEKQSIKAAILADSIERIGNNRITTWQLTYPRFIHSEIMTHRVLSKNSASSRAIPFNKMVEQVENDPFIPIKWMKDHKGMQGEEFITKESHVQDCINAWLEARDYAVHKSSELNGCGEVTKQICNRLLEPFMWHTIICTGTEWENFFALRAHPMAEIHLQDLAYKMLDVYNASIPKELKEGEWHIPFENEIDIYSKEFKEACNIKDYTVTGIFDSETMSIKDSEIIILNKIKISTAKCAQVSYMKFGSDNYEDLIDLHNSLFIRPYEGKRGIREINDPIHASPAEHIAQAMTELEYYSFIKGIQPTSIEKEGDIFNMERYCTGNWKENPTPDRYGWCHNLRGFKSYRSMLPNENSTDSRVIKK